MNSASRTRMRSPVLIAGSLLLTAFLARPTAADEPEAKPAQTSGAYAGAASCTDCHEDQVHALAKTPHGKQAFADLAAHGCETCHGALADHVKSPNNKKFRPPKPSAMTPEEQVALCQACHTGGKQMLWNGSAHAGGGVSCLDCHSVHAPQSDRGQIKTADVSDTCFACHKDVRADTRKTSHHPIREGKIGCSDCHNPHGTTSEKNLNASSVNELCYQCHTEKRGPFLWEHAPVREDCMNCHTPHGSNHAKLQRTAVPYLCQQCHSNTRHPGTLYDALTLPGAQKASNRLDNRGCVNCHAAIHGSNHPSGPYLGR